MTSDAGKAYKSQPLIAVNTTLDILAVISLRPKKKKRKRKGTSLSEWQTHSRTPTSRPTTHHALGASAKSLPRSLSLPILVCVSRPFCLTEYRHQQCVCAVGSLRHICRPPLAPRHWLSKTCQPTRTLCRIAGGMDCIFTKWSARRAVRTSDIHTYSFGKIPHNNLQISYINKAGICLCLTVVCFMRENIFNWQE